MAFLAPLLIRLVARRSAAPFEQATLNPARAQQELLQRIMERNRDTEYGREHGFAGVRSLADYRGAVPVVSYDDIRERIDRMTRGERSVLTAEDPVLFAQTSGTTGQPKYIPVTPTCRKGGGMTAWLHYAHRDHPTIFDRKMLTIVSPAIEGYTDAGLPYGSTSGMVVKEMPRVVQSAYAVPYPAFEIHDYEAKYYALLRFALAEPLSFLATANPSSILKLAQLADTFAESLIRDIHDGTLSCELEPTIRAALAPGLGRDPARAHALETMRAARGRLVPADYWPDIDLLGCWKGGTVGAYIEQLGEWYDPDDKGMVSTRDMGYLASEARMSIPVSDHGAGGVPTVHLNVFELVPCEQIEEHPDDASEWDFLGIDEIEIGQQYYVFLTTTGGLYRYDINDVIEVVERYHQTPVIVFRRKGRGMTNLTGEKVSVNQVIEAIDRAGKTLGVHVTHFRAEPDMAASRYVFKIEVAGALPESRRIELLRAIDANLGELNIEWAAKRGSGRLREPVLQLMREGWYERGKQRLVAEGRRLFQAKTVLLDAKRGYHPEPEELEAQVELQ